MNSRVVLANGTEIPSGSGTKRTHRERHQEPRTPADCATGATRKAAACHFWTCPAPGCSGIVYRPPGEPVDCPRCGEPIDLDLVARVAEQRAETERVKAPEGKAMSGPAPGGAHA